MTCSRARPQPVVWMAPACARFLRAIAALSGHVPSPWFDEPQQAYRFLRATAVLPGRVPSPWFDEPRQSRRLLFAAAVLPWHVLSPWFGDPGAHVFCPCARALQAHPPAQSVSCCSAVSVCRREVAQRLLSSVLESSGLITSCAAYPRDPASPVSSHHCTVVLHAGCLPDNFYSFPQLINIDTLLTNNGPGNNFRL